MEVPRFIMDYITARLETRCMCSKTITVPYPPPLTWVVILPPKMPPLELVDNLVEMPSIKIEKRLFELQRVQYNALIPCAYYKEI